MTVVCGQTSAPADSPQWASWRGPDQTGFHPDANPPSSWSATENVRWKVEIPGRGHSSPVVFGSHIYLTTAIKTEKRVPPRMSGRPGAHDNLPVDAEHEFFVLCVSRESGQVLWKTSVNRAIPVEGGHNTASLASASPVADENHVYASFGSHGIFCLSADGKIVWQKQLGQMHTKHGHGEGSSPALFGDTLIVNWDHEGQSFVVAMDKSTGETIWQRQRDEVTSWSTPIVVTVEDRPQVIVCGTDRVRAYDLKDGSDLWQCGGMSANIVATPVFSSGIVYVGSSYEKRALMAIDIRGATGDLTDTSAVLWSRSRGTPYVPSPLLANDTLYFLTHYQNVLTGVDSKSGTPKPGAMRLGALGNIYASPVAAADRIYITDLDGVTQVLSIDQRGNPKSVAVNPINESVSASAAIAGEQFFLRGEKHLFCFEESE